MKRFAHARSRQVDPHPQAVQPACASSCAKPLTKLGRPEPWVIRATRSACSLQINRTWDSALVRRRQRTMRQMLEEDLKMRKFIIETRMPQAAISKVVIERPAKLCRVSIYAARPGVIIGKKGADIEKLRTKLASMTSERSQAQHRRDQEARDRRQARRPGHRRPAGAPRGVPPGDEARCSRRCGWAPRASRSPAAAAWAAPRSPASSGIARAACRCTPCAPHRLCRGRGADRYGVIGIKCWIFKGEISATIRWRRTA